MSSEIQNQYLWALALIGLFYFLFLFSLILNTRKFLELQSIAKVTLQYVQTDLCNLLSEAL